MRGIYKVDNIVNKASGVVLLVAAVAMYTAAGLIIRGMLSNAIDPLFIAKAIGVAIVAAIGTLVFGAGVIVYRDKSEDMPEWMWMRYG